MMVTGGPNPVIGEALCPGARIKSSTGCWLNVFCPRRLGPR